LLDKPPGMSSNQALQRVRHLFRAEKAGHTGSLDPLATGLLPAGQPIHDMLLRLVVDARFDIVEAGAETRAMPYPGACNEYGDIYGRLVGLNLMRGFRHAVKERLGGVQGCTHLTELTQVLPTAVVQAFAGEVIDTRGDSADSAQPFQIDRCHALRADGPAVRTHYPRWYRAPQTSACANSPPSGDTADVISEN